MPIVARLGLLLALGCAPAAHGADAAPTEALDAVVAELNELATWFDRAERRRLGWLKDVEQADQAVITLNGRIDELSQDLAALALRLGELNDESQELEAMRSAQAERIGDHLAMAYRLQGRDFLKTLLDQSSAAEVTRVMIYHRYFGEAHARAIDQYNATLTELESVREAVGNTRDRRARESAALNEQRAQLVEQRAQRQNLLEALKDEIADKTSLRRRLEADQQRLQRLIDALRRRSARLDGAGFAARKGKLPRPVAGQIQYRFGEHHASGQLRWRGTRFAAAAGAEFTAVHRGRVAFADWLRGYGLLAIVDHGDGYMTLYGHADALTKTVGDWVESGEVMGRSGQSGGQTTNGVYFEVRHKGVHQNPAQWLAP